MGLVDTVCHCYWFDHHNCRSDPSSNQDISFWRVISSLANDFHFTLSSYWLARLSSLFLEAWWCHTLSKCWQQDSFQVTNPLWPFHYSIHNSGKATAYFSDGVGSPCSFGELGNCFWIIGIIVLGIRTKSKWGDGKFDVKYKWWFMFWICWNFGKIV